MNAAQPVTDEDVERILIRIEQGKGGKDDANCLRNYLRGLRSMLSAWVLQSEDESIGDDG